MTDYTDASPARSLAGRPPAASVIAACLAEQAKLLSRKRLADVLGVSPLADDAEPWFTGAIGELAVARELARLDAEAGWRVFHAVPVGDGDSDIDHVVVGPPGAFTINTKHHKGKRVSVGRSEIFVNGRNGRYIKKSAFEASRASQLLTAATGFSVTAQPILAIVGAKEIKGKRELGGVRIVDAAALAGWLRKQPTIWGADASTAVTRAAALPGTWRAGVADFGTDAANAASFAELRRRVALMERVRALWALGGALALVGGGYAVLEALLHAHVG